MKKLFVALLMMGVLKGLDAQETMPCCAPPFISNIVKPNVLLVLDVTGSMRWRAAWDGTYSRDQWGNWYCDPAYDPSRNYYGYFHPDSIYRHRNNVWRAVGYDPSHTVFDMSNTGMPRISGNILNWGVMSRMDAAKKALAGGKGTPGNLYNKNRLIGEGDGGSGYRGGWRTWPVQGDDGNWYCFDKPWYYSNHPEDFYIYRFNTSTHRWTYVDDYECRVDVRNVPDELKIGVIGQIADKDLDGYWDPEAPRFGLLIFSTSQFDLEFELYQSEDDPDMEPLFNIINGIDPGGGTPVGNAVLEAIHYIRYCQSHFGTYTWHGPNTKWDPYMNFRGNVITDSVYCRKNFVIIIGDGESNSDSRISNDWHLPNIQRSLCNYFDYSDEPGRQYDCQDGSGDTDDPADDYAYYGHITDLRPDDDPNYGLECPQTIDFFALFAFGQGSQLFKDLAALGGFEDKNGNSIPDGYYTSGPIPTDPYDEWDQNDDGEPDNYYDARSGGELESAIRAILARILAGATSASQASVVSQTTKGEGIGTFALFYPRKNIGGGVFRSWIGEIKGIWVDRFGLLREETEGNLSLDLNDDYVINFESPDTTDICDPQQTVYVYRYRDTSCTGQNLEFVDQITLDQLQPLWDGGEFLWNTNPDERTIYTGVDQDKNNVVRASENEIIDFTTSNLSAIYPYLDVYSTDYADTLIRYIRGYDFPPRLRRRAIDGKVWKLGDIIYSSPMFVQEPMERYDLLYLDEDYKDFYEVYQDRRGVVYVGANDGMIHAFNVGRYIKDAETGCEPGHVDPMGIPIGKEIWAYLPFNLLPHLKWLPEPDYCHVYYVDLKPYPTDVKIFTPDQKHVGGFGTVLIGSARLGGKTYDLSIDTLSSSYFCIDVTDPEEPVVLWERALPDSSFTTPYPNVVKVEDEWFLVIGSGPQLCSGFSSKYAKVYILNLKTGEILRTFTVSEANSAIGDIMSVDLGLDYTVDLIYFGTYYYTGNQNNPNWQGRVYRIKTHGDPNPANWDLTLLIDLGKPVTAPGAATMDEFGNLWVYFGSGRLFYDDDETDIEEQVFVGIKDDTVSTYTYADLIDVTDYQIYGDSVSTGTGTISWEELVANIRSADGWHRRFSNPTGERCLSRPLVIGGAVIFTTYYPQGNICEFGGEGKLYALYYLTGTAYKEPILGEVGGESVPSVDLGGGMPSEPSMWIGSSQEKAFIQIGGEIKDVTPVLPLNPRGGLIMWKGR
jgi:type IV pilus assembly protein PilY1